MRQRLLVIAAALAAFAGTLFGSFHFDDYALFSDPALLSSGGWWEVWRLAQTRPLTWFTFWLNFQFGGAWPLPFHAVNLLIHLTACVLLLAALRRILPERDALIAALLFAVHPIQTEPVAYVFARATLLCTLFSIASLWLWMGGRKWAALAAFAAALLAKEECAAFPLALLLLSWKRSDWDRRRWLPPALAMLTLSIAAGLRVIAVAGAVGGSGAGAGSRVSPADYLSYQGMAVLRYLFLWLVPWGFTVDVDLPAAPWIRIAAWLILLAAPAFCWRHIRENSAARWCIAGLLLLIPSSTLFPADDLAADRRMYLPVAAFSAAAALLIRRWRAPAIATITVALALISIRYSMVWRTERSLWTEAMHRSPGKLRPRIQLSRAIPPAEALTLLDAAPPDDPLIASERGRVYLELGRPADALAAFGRALAAAPSDASAINNRGAALLALGQLDAARMDFERALKINPCLFDARLNLKRMGAAPLPANCRFTPAQELQLADR